MAVDSGSQVCEQLEGTCRQRKSWSFARRMDVFRWRTGLTSYQRRRGRNVSTTCGCSPHPGMNCGRPIADILRDEIYELRPSHWGVQYRILYFFRDRDVVVLSHGIMKRQKVPDVEIRRAAERKRLVPADPQRYSFRLVPKEV